MEKAKKYPGCRIALVASTIADARDTMIEGDSGLLNCLDNEDLRGGSDERAWNRSLVELFMNNGSQFKGYSSEKSRKLRGPQFHFAWGDESAFWTDAFKGTITDTTWSNLAIATRLPRRYDWSRDYRSQIVVATTPRPVALLSSTDPDPARAGLMQRETTIITRGRTVDNLSNLSEQYRANVIAPLLGTRLGRQELDGEMLEDRQDALWRREWIDGNRISPSAVPEHLVRVIVAVDPAVSDGETAAETGIIVAGADNKGHGYVLGDYTLRGTPKECMSEAIRAYNVHQADRVVAEINNGGDYIGNLLRMIDPDVPYKAVRATRGKQTRAEPISALYEQGRIHHAGQYQFLEDQLCQWSPLDEESPDRLDACLVSGTLVLAKRGNVPIEDIIPGELVWTRQGWKPVIATRCTMRNANVMTVELSDGGHITGTPDHKIWTDRGWARLDSLVCGDTLSAWTSNQKPAHVSVVRSYAVDAPSDVYDISVQDVHEFVASGVIVHNCVWAFTDLKDIVQVSWTQAYGVLKCVKCSNPFFKSANGVERKACPGCGFPVETESTDVDDGD